MRWVLRAVLAAVAVITPAAWGAPYEVTACGAAPGGVNSAWKASNTTPGLLDVTPACVAGGASGGLLAQDASSPGLQTPPGAAAEWRFDAPAGTQVTGIRAARVGFAELDDGWVVRLRDGAGTTIESCSSGPGVPHCDLGAGGVPAGSSTQALTVTGLATPSLAYGVACRGPAACQNAAGGGAHLVFLAIRGVTVVVDDPTAPTVAGVAGPLRAAAGWLSGPQSLSITASDEGGGVAAVELVADGRDPPRASQALACDYTRPAPCPSAATQMVTLDTTALADGTHTLQAVAFDATKPWSTVNRGASAVWSVQIDNTSPVPSALAVTGVVRARSAFAVSWNRAADPGAPVVKAEWRVRSSGGATVATGSVQRLDPRRIDRLRVPRNGAWRVGVRLTDAAGHTGPERTVLVRAGAIPHLDALGATVVGRTVRVRLARVTRGVQQVRVLRARARTASRVVLGAWRLGPLSGRTLVVPVPRGARGETRLLVQWRPLDGGRWRSVLVTIGKAAVR